jgi:hypothetical protein
MLWACLLAAVDSGEIRATDIGVRRYGGSRVMARWEESWLASLVIDATMGKRMYAPENGGQGEEVQFALSSRRLRHPGQAPGRFMRGWLTLSPPIWSRLEDGVRPETGRSKDSAFSLA